MTLTKILAATVLKLLLLALVLSWVWLAAGVALTDAPVLTLRFGIVLLCLALAALILIGQPSSMKPVLAAAYGIIFALVAVVSIGGLSGGGVIQTVQIDLEGYPQQTIVQLLPRDQLGNQALFETLMAMRETPYDLERTWEEEIGVQAVGRSAFSPMSIGGF